jgi:hypothetical protein
MPAKEAYARGIRPGRRAAGRRRAVGKRLVYVVYAGIGERGQPNKQEIVACGGEWPRPCESRSGLGRASRTRRGRWFGAHCGLELEETEDSDRSEERRVSKGCAIAWRELPVWRQSRERPGPGARKIRWSLGRPSTWNGFSNQRDSPDQHSQPTASSALRLRRASDPHYMDSCCSIPACAGDFPLPSQRGAAPSTPRPSASAPGGSNKIRCAQAGLICYHGATRTPSRRNRRAVVAVSVYCNTGIADKRQAAGRWRRGTT